MYKSITTSKGYTLTAGTPLIFPKNSGRNSFFIVNTSNDEIEVAFGENPQAGDFIPVVSDYGHLAPIPTPTSRITFQGNGSIVIMSDNHRTLDSVTPVIVKGPNSQKVDYDGTANLSVEVLNEDGMSFQWFRDGAEVGTDSPTYAAANVQYSTSVYVVVSNANGGEAKSETAVITNNYTFPSFTAQPVGDTVLVGNSATFSVTVDASHPLTYQWYLREQNGTLTAIGGDSDSVTVGPVDFDDYTSEVFVEVSDGRHKIVSQSAGITPAFQLGNFTGTEGAFAYVDGITNPIQEGQRMTLQDGVLEGLAQNLEAGMIFVGDTNGRTMSIALDPSNSNIFEFYYNPSTGTDAEFREDFAYPAIFKYGGKA